MKLNEEKDIILKWVYSVRKAMEPKKKEIKIKEKEEADEKVRLRIRRIQL